MDFKDYYQTLGVKRDASEKQIRSAFRKLARKHHPDVNPGDPEAEARFKEVNEAHEVLSDPEKRQMYDRFGADWQRYQQAQPADQAAGAGRAAAEDFGQWFTGQARAQGGGPRVEFHDFSSNGGGDFSNFFESLFGGSGRARDARRAGRAVPRRGEDVEYDVEISLEEADRGAMRQLELQLADACPTCGGTGISNGSRCPTCGGTGYVVQTKRLEARIPAGVQDGTRIRLAGQGGRGDAGGPSGDVYLRVHLRPHPRFEREGSDLKTTIDVPLYTAILGGEAMVPSLSGSLALRLPPETQNGRVFRLRGKGLARPSGGRGDLLARANVVLPTGLTERERELFEELRALRERQTAQTGATR